MVHLPYCVTSLAATIEDGMVYKFGHSADRSEAYMLDGTDKSLQNWNIATSAEDQENQNILCKKCKTKHLKFFTLSDLVYTLYIWTGYICFDTV